ncbi:hypothetical protein UUU_38070 [Klebsiella pneumoniae subsp. pneumoniae DSM 30104 = JCM 1662 = NBRC 14940]|nr:hypothetical protein UUU_38070 [Klebsiella pneumoniae subsp. pneumoniae DSM 30104 = JCM 1662 = NBRC 14940]
MPKRFERSRTNTLPCVFTISTILFLRSNEFILICLIINSSQCNRRVTKGER